MTTSVLKRRGLSARVQEGDGPAVLWLHGYTLGSSVWDQLWKLLPRWTHIGVDLPGHGMSDPFGNGDRLGDWVERIARFADEVGARHLAGFSFGGMIALQAGIAFPGQWRSLTLASPALAGGPIERDAQMRNLELARLYQERGPGPWMTELWMRSPPAIFLGASKHPELERQLRELVDQYMWSDQREGLMDRLVEAPQDARSLGQVTCPTLILIGDEDMASFKRAGELIRRGITKSRRMYVAGAGHLCLLELPSVCAAMVEEHLAEQELAHETTT